MGYEAGERCSDSFNLFGPTCEEKLDEDTLLFTMVSELEDIYERLQNFLCNLHGIQDRESDEECPPTALEDGSVRNDIFVGDTLEEEKKNRSTIELEHELDWTGMCKDAHDRAGQEEEAARIT